MCSAKADSAHVHADVHGLPCYSHSQRTSVSMLLVSEGTFNALREVGLSMYCGYGQMSMIMPGIRYTGIVGIDLTSKLRLTCPLEHRVRAL